MLKYYPIIRIKNRAALFRLNMGQHYCQNHIRRTKGCHGRQLMYCTKGSIFYRNSKRLLLIHFPFKCGFLFLFYVPCGGVFL